jgi:hypothetical protein
MREKDPVRTRMIAKPERGVAFRYLLDPSALPGHALKRRPITWTQVSEKELLNVQLEHFLIDKVEHLFRARL